MTAAATFCATLVDEFARRGITQAFVSPGSRSTPLLLALDADQRMDLHLFHDERSASFAALGHGNASGTPGIVLCTSGTAAAHIHAAVIEADLSAVPLIVCTADRPPELWDRGAPQTIDQTRLYGDSVRLFVEPGPPDTTDPSTWRPLAADLVESAAGKREARPGPVHANLSFRDPLIGASGPLPPAIPITETSTPPGMPEADAVEIARRCCGRHGVIVVGRGVSRPRALVELAERLGWPIIADHRSGVRSDRTVNHADALLRHQDFADSHRPEVVLRFGEPLASKTLSRWLTVVGATGAEVISCHQPGRLIDPEDIATMVVPEHGAAEAILGALDDGITASAFGEHWLKADRAARRAVTEVLAQHPTSEAAIALRSLHSVGPDGAVVVSSSMPVRYLEWLDSTPPARTRVIANRGANGIDGVIATAIGVALTGTPTLCLLGDLAFLHDSSSLTALSRRDIDLTIVVLDNDGGGIFSFLPQAQLLEPGRFDRLFGTPHGTDLVALSKAHGLNATTDTADLTPERVRVVVARTPDRPAQVEVMEQITAAVASTLDP